MMIYSQPSHPPLLTLLLSSLLPLHPSPPPSLLLLLLFEENEDLAYPSPIVPLAKAEAVSGPKLTCPGIHPLLPGVDRRIS